MAKSTATRSRKRSSSLRDSVRRPKRSAYAKRSSTGRFREMDDVGRSLKGDRRTKAKRKVRSGYGDQGDQQKRKARSRARTSR